MGAKEELMNKRKRNQMFEKTKHLINASLQRLTDFSKQLDKAEDFSSELYYEFQVVINALSDFNRDVSLDIRKALEDDLFTFKEVFKTLDENEFKTLRNRLNIYSAATLQLDQGFTKEEAVSLSRLFHRLQNIVVMKLEKLIHNSIEKKENEVKTDLEDMLVEQTELRREIKQLKKKLEHECKATERDEYIEDGTLALVIPLALVGGMLFGYFLAVVVGGTYE